jgi:P-type Cu2+ transporter
MKIREGKRKESRSAQNQSTETAQIQERIRQRAYELYEQRGRQDGHAEQDWLEAEREISKAAAASFKAAAA